MIPYLAGAALVVAALILFAMRRAGQGKDHGMPPAPAVSPPATPLSTPPCDPPISEAEFEALRAALEDDPLPALGLDPDPARTILPTGSRFGGPAWLAAGESWPCDASGIPLEFIAQLNFSELPHLPDFPESGLLQFFIKRDDLYGANFEAPLQGEARVIWRSHPGDGLVHAPPPLEESPARPFADFSPLTDGKTRNEGLAIAAIPFMGLPDPLGREIEPLASELFGRPGDERVEAMLDAQAERSPVHHAGGHPAFTQWDFRPVLGGDMGEYDRVLLRLTSDDTFMWGDSGEAVFMIRREDLLRKDFSRVVFWWDCL